MATARVKVTVSFFAEVDSDDYPDDDWEPNEDGDDDQDESDRPMLTLDEAIKKFKSNLKDGSESIAEAVDNSDEIDGVQVEMV
jgi:hypothetical protein